MKNLDWLNDDDILALLELRDDTLFDRLSAEQVNYYISESRKIGSDFARRYKGKNLEEILKENDVEVLIEDKVKGNKNFNIRAQIHFEDNIRQITIYRESIKQIYDILNTYTNNITEEDVVKIHLAHEFFHYLEYKYSKYTNCELNGILIYKLGWIKKESTILRTREIAAHEFSKTFLELEIHPKLIDYLYLFKKDELYKKRLKEEVSELKQKYLYKN